ncbi:MAG: hypothetical protein AUH35_04130 [Nitrospirae bacterium 13_1_40CM_62_7]|nr:MAG: hypothetical protein AUH35_04130 [Nitrospirae bacterium 13_1_40CM_62_7]
MVEQVAQLIRRGGVVAIPTESFYALGVISDRAQLDPLVAEITPAASMLIARFWPGPLTIILPASPLLPDGLTAGTGTVGVRQTADPVLVRLLRQTGPLTGTSANRSGQPAARSAEEVEKSLGSELDLIVDVGPTSGGPPSTIVDAVGPIRLLREGPISRQQLAAALAHSGMSLVS